MLTKYAGFEIEVERAKSLGGWEQLYYTVIRMSDGWIFQDSFEDSEETLGDKTQQLKNLVDDYLKHPKDYDE